MPHNFLIIVHCFCFKILEKLRLLALMYSERFPLQCLFSVLILGKHNLFQDYRQNGNYISVSYQKVKTNSQKCENQN